MIPTEVHSDISREVDLFENLLEAETVLSRFTKCGYQGDHLYVRGYMEDSDPHDEHRYYHEMLVPAIESFANLLNNANFIEFDRLPSLNELTNGNPVNHSVIQVVGGGPEYGFWLRKTTSYQFCIPGDVCPEHVAPEGYYGSDDLNNCPEDCTFVPKFKGYGPGTQVIYDVSVRTSPRLQVK